MKEKSQADNNLPSSVTDHNLIPSHSRQISKRIYLLRLKRYMLKHPRSSSSVSLLVQFYKCHHYFNLSPKYKRRQRTTLVRSEMMQDWTPPINTTTLSELSISYIFKSIQLRHDLVFDQHLQFRPNTDRVKTEHYWNRVHSAFTTTSNFEFLVPIIQELCRILMSLMRPRVSLPWYWPTSITQNEVQDMLDAEFIVQQLNFNRRIGDERVVWLKFIFESLLQGHKTRHVEIMCRYFREGRYAKALKQCFSILETIKLMCANRVLEHYRNYLIDTCAEYEHRCFDKRRPKLTSVSRWFEATRKRIQGINSKNIFYAGLVYLIADDERTRYALDLPAVKWPITLKFDKRRFTHQFRYEFQTILDLLVIMIPYRHLLGNLVRFEDIQSLKQAYLELTTNELHKLSQIICKRAGESNVVFWENWLYQNLQAKSCIYRLMYDRVCRHLQFFAQYGCMMETSTQEVGILTQELEALGKKIKLVADLNLKTYGNLYSALIKNKRLQN